MPSPSPEFDRLEPVMEDRGFDSEAPYSYDESAEEAERYAPSQPSAPRPRIAPDRGREPKRSAVFPFKSAIAVGIVLILIGAGILWGKSVVSSVSGLFKSSPTVVEAPIEAMPNEPEANKLFRMVMKFKGSDLHLKVGMAPAMRLAGVLRLRQLPPL